MRKLLPFLAVAVLSCSKESTLEDMNTAGSDAGATTTVASTARTSAVADLEGNWRRTETRYNRGDGNQYWQPASPQSVVKFQSGKLFPGDHPYLSQFYAYEERTPGVLHLTGNSATADVPYRVSGSTLELTYRQREEVVDRFVKL
ncbi:hypothetical protein [Flaviaesturariibacter aridisoli]|uniref:Lipocalin-like domain-containing protein n=1 Tax=Flaviaesturariibacter aridisoli TaxID=2545761 RepID=A0A4V2WMQ3_9BACT|nr:hypothetical protein [Flaviaesturariibacter aridisoli]TCZ71025.1 hypothetical protein E0486_10400 [Flaviaesturariibacter aridisoli]